MIAVVADDFSGSAEMGGIALRYGKSVEICTKPISSCESDLLIIDSNTRSSTEENAVEQIAEIATMLRDLTPDWIYKKIDSVLRGHLLPEIKEMMDQLNIPLALLVPANPSAGRVIDGGHYYIHGVPLHETEFAQDIDFPVAVSDVLKRFTDQDGVHLEYRSVDQGIPETGIVIGECNNSMEMRSWTNINPANTLPAGSSDYFDALLGSQFERQEIELDSLPDFSKNVLCVCGSNSPNRVNSIKMFGQKQFILGEIPASFLENFKNKEKAIDEWVSNILKEINGCEKLVIAVSQSLPPIENLTERLLELVTVIVAKILDQFKVNELFVEGGSTASAIVRHMGWQRFIPTQELGPGVVRMNVACHPEINLTVKPGSYKWPDFI